jgi:transcription termination factor Rho
MTITTTDAPQAGVTRRRRTRGHAPAETAVSPDTPLSECAGILDLTDRSATLRTSGYLPGWSDVTVPSSLVKANGLRRGDWIAGAAQVSGERRVLARIDTINGLEPDESAKRPAFNDLTPLYPNERLLLETEGNNLTNRMIDLMMPIGKGQRALIASPPKAGKTTVLVGIANAIAHNNPECHIMAVLVDERPEEVTDIERTIQGEVISSTFDRKPSEHTNLAELAIERAKRLVELGGDVVVLLDNLTRLGRAYNNAAPASGRILSGGIDAAALYPPKRFLGAARNIEDGGSLTILATALVETGSVGDGVIFEEYKSTGNAELKLDRRAAERRVFPAIDVQQSGTRKDELLMGEQEYAAMTRLRRLLSGMEPQQALDVVVEQLKKTRSNAELMMNILRTS